MMADLISEEIERVWQLLNEGKEAEALQTLEILEKNRDLTLENHLICMILKGTLYTRFGKFEDALSISKQAYHESEKLGMLLYSIDTFFIKFHAKWNLNTMGWDSTNEDIKQCEKVLDLSEQELSEEIELKKAILLFPKSIGYLFAGAFEQALEGFKKSLKVLEGNNHYSFLVPGVLMFTGFVYKDKGDINRALEFLSNGLSRVKGNSFIAKEETSRFLIERAECYYLQGNFDKALADLEKGLAISKEIKISTTFCRGMEIWIKILIEKGDFEKAQYCLQRLQKFNQQEGVLFLGDGIFREKISKARILKSSPRTRDRAEAEKILVQMLEERLIAFSKILVLIELCDLLLIEFSLTKEMGVFEEIISYISNLLELADRTDSFYTLAETYLLQSKLALIQMNMGDARRLLTQAQRLADENKLDLLAREISKEHDKLLDQLDKWENMDKSNAPITERLDLASLSEIIDRLQGKRALDPPELVSEDPILLLIMSYDGVSYFNHSFIENWDFDDLFSAFLSAFNTFSSEIFSKSIDRIKIDENVILIKPVETFLVCYIIKGQSYSALQRLSRFSDAIKWNTEIWKALNKSVKTSEMLELNKPPSLGIIVNEIFNL